MPAARRALILLRGKIPATSEVTTVVRRKKKKSKRLSPSSHSGSAGCLGGCHSNCQLPFGSSAPYTFTVSKARVKRSRKKHTANGGGRNKKGWAKGAQPRQEAPATCLSALPAVCNPHRHQPGLFRGARAQPRVNKSTPRVTSPGPGEAHPQGSGSPGGHRRCPCRRRRARNKIN